MEFQEQHVQETKKNVLTILMEEQTRQIYKICTKKCVTKFDNKDLSDKEKQCLAKCFDRKLEAFFKTMELTNTYSMELEKKHNEQYLKDKFA